MLDGAPPENDPKEVGVVVMQAFIDASGTQQQRTGRMLCAAGFVATKATWSAFQRDWSAALNRAGIEQFRMTDCAQFTGPFKPWRGDEKRRRTFLAELVDIASRYEMRGIGRAIRIADFRTLNIEYHAETYLGGPYAICAALVADRARGSDLVKRLRPRRLDIFVEHGDCGQSDLAALMQRNVLKQTPIIIPKKKKNARGEWEYVRPFELADMLAYEGRLTLERMGDGKQPRGLATYIEEKLATNLAASTLDGMRDTCNKARIPPRMDRVLYARGGGAQ